MTRPRAVAVLADLPFPPRSGNHLRYLQNLRLLDALGYEVLAVAGAAREDRDEAGLGPVGELVEVVPVPGYELGAGARLRRAGTIAAGALRTPAVDPWDYNHSRAGFDDAVLGAVERERPDAVLVRSLFGHLVPGVRERAPQASVVLDAHDSQALVAQALRAQERGLARWGLRLRQFAAARAERGYSEADELWVTSERERDHFRAAAPGVPSRLVPNGMEPAPDAPPAGGRAPELLLVGGFGWPPNLAAARTLVDDILPRVLRARDDAFVTLIGRDLDPAFQESWSGRPVRWLGTVDEISPHFRRAAALVFAPPPSAATGTPLKISEALASGTPVAATPVACEALGLRAGVHAVIAEDPPELADGVIRILQDPEYAEGLARAGLEWAREHLSTQSIASALGSESVLAR